MLNSVFTAVAWLLVSAVAIAAPPVRDGDIKVVRKFLRAEKALVIARIKNFGESDLIAYRELLTIPWLTPAQSQWLTTHTSIKTSH